MSANGGITKGKSHKEGGIPMVVKSTGQQVELEGGEGVINKRNMASDKKFEFQGKQMTTCEIASAINSANGNGVQIDCDDVTGKKYAYEDGGVVFINYKQDEIMYEPIDKKYYANDKEFDSLEEAQKFLDSGGINEDLRGAYERGLFKNGGKILNEVEEQSFQEWMTDGNVAEEEKDVYSTQDAQYRNRLKGMDELRKYFRKEFLSDSYEGGGGIGKKVKTFKQLETHPFVYEILYEYQEGVYDESDYIYVLHLVYGKWFETLDSGIITAPSKLRLVHYFNEYNIVDEKNNSFKGGGSVGNVYIALSKTKNGLLLSERFDKQITHKQLFDYYKKKGYEIIDSNIFKVTNKGVLDVFKDAISKFIKEKYNELVDWQNTLLSYKIVGDRIIAQSCFVQTKNGNEYKITPNDLVNKKFAKGGWLLINSDTERIIQEYDTESEAREMMYEYDGDSFVMKKSELEKEKLRETYRPPAPLNPATYIGMERGGGVKDYNSLIGKYVNIYSMGVSSPTEHQIKNVEVSGENFRYRYVTLKFDLGIAPIPFNEATAFMNNEIIYVNDNKEEFGVQLMSNQYKKGGSMSNSLKYEDYETASMAMGGGYEEQIIVPQDVAGMYKEGGEVDLPKANKMFHLPLELAVYVPSTQDVDKVISDSELKERVDEVSEYLARLFGGFTKSDKIGGFMSSKSELVTEDVVPVVSFATKDDFNANKDKLVNKLSEWAKRWGQEAIGFEFEGDLYYVPESFANGGNIKKKNYKNMTKHKYAQGGGVNGETQYYVAMADIRYFDSEGEYKKYNTYNHIKAESEEQAKMIILRFIENALGKNEWEWEDEDIYIAPAQKSAEEIEFRGFLSASDFGGLTKDKFNKGRFAEGGMIEEIKRKYQTAGSDSRGVYTYSKSTADEIARKYDGDVQEDGSKWYVSLGSMFSQGGGIKHSYEITQEGNEFIVEFLKSNGELDWGRGGFSSREEAEKYALENRRYAQGGEVGDDILNGFAVVINKEDKNFAKVGFTTDDIKKDSKGDYLVLQFDKTKKKYYLDDINLLKPIDDFVATSKNKYLLLKEIQEDETLYYYIIRLEDKKVYTEGGSMESIKEELSNLTNGKHFLVKSGAYFDKGGDVRDFEWYQMWKKDQVKKGTAHEMEHIDSIREFKKRGVSDKEVAQAIAQDHLDENENYYIELKKMEESSAKVSNALQDFEHQKSKRKSSRKYNLGGLLGNDKPVNVHIILVEDYEAVVRSKDGTYLNDVNLKKDKVYKFGFLFDEGKDVAFDLGDGSNNFMLIPSNLVVVVGYDEEKMELGGEVKSYAEYDLDRNDKSILKLLLNINARNATAEQRDKVSTFKGNNVVNDLSPKLIQKIYGILFQNHNVDNKILNLYISNIGVGNILMYAPSYLHKTMVSFDEKNQFVQVEKEIANIVTEGVRAFVFNEFELTDMDGFIHVYPQVNPKVDELCSIFYKSKKKAVAVGVCEFTTRQKLDEFQRSIVINQGSSTLSQMINFAKSNDYLIVNEGITSEGDYTLIYTMTKY